MFNFVASGARMQLPLAIPLRMLGSQASKQPVTASKATTVPSGRARTVVNSSPLVSRSRLPLSPLPVYIGAYACMYVCMFAAHSPPSPLPSCTPHSTIYIKLPEEKEYKKV